MKLKFNYTTILIGLLFIILQGCKKEKPKVEDLPELLKGTVLVLNEGNFGWGNATVGIYEPEERTYSDKAFAVKNNRDLGDILQSALLVEEELYLVVNNSGKIEVVNKNDMVSKRILNVGGSPRYLSKIDGLEEAYLTDFTGNFIRRIHLNTGDIIKEIAMQGFNEGIVNMGNGFFAFENITKKKLYLIDSRDNVVKDSCSISGRMSGFNEGKDHGIYYLDGGSDSEPFVLYRLDFQSFSNPQVVFSKSVDKAISRVDYSGNGWVYINGNQLVFTDESGGITQEATLPQGNYYAMSVFPELKEIYISDAKDYTQQSNVMVYDMTGKKTHEFTAGRISSGFVYLD